MKRPRALLLFLASALALAATHDVPARRGRAH
jgi:hypothetical protein